MSIERELWIRSQANDNRSETEKVKALEGALLQEFNGLIYTGSFFSKGIKYVESFLKNESISEEKKADKVSEMDRIVVGHENRDWNIGTLIYLLEHQKISETVKEKIIDILIRVLEKADTEYRKKAANSVISNNAWIDEETKKRLYGNAL